MKRPSIDVKGPQAGTVWLLTITYASVGFSIYFALGVVAKRGLGLTPLIFLAAGLLFVLTMFTYIEGSAMLRERGGSSAFARHAYNELIAFVAGWVILLDYLIVIALAVLSVPHYLEPITGNLDGTLWATAISAGVLVYITTLNVLDIPARRRPRLLIGLAASDFVLQILVVAVGALVVMNPERLTDHVNLFSTPGISDVVYAAALAMLAYAGIEAVSNLVPDLDLDARDFGRSVTRAIWVVPVLYAAMAAIALMAVPVVIGGGLLAFGIYQMVKPKKKKPDNLAGYRAKKAAEKRGKNKKNHTVKKLPVKAVKLLYRLSVNFKVFGFLAT